MNIYRALAEVRGLKEKIEQLAGFRKETNSYDEGTEPEFRFDDLTGEIETTFERLTKLKLAIQGVNMANIVAVDGEEMSLAKAILELANVRARLGYVGEILQTGRRGLLDLDRQSGDTRKVAQKSKADLLRLQEQYRKRRASLDSAIQEANTKLAVPV